jgi:hypothetical protein
MKDSEKLILNLKESIGNKDPIEFFSMLVDAFDILFNKIDSLTKDNNKLRTFTALSIKWEPKIASDLLSKQIEILRQDKLTYHNEIHNLKAAYAEGKVVRSYDEFCSFWINELGWHPFLDYRD